MAIAFGAMVTAVGFATRQYWLVGLDVLAILYTTAGLLCEYYVGDRAAALKSSDQE